MGNQSSQTYNAESNDRGENFILEIEHEGEDDDGENPDGDSLNGRLADEKDTASVANNIIVSMNEFRKRLRHMWFSEEDDVGFYAHAHRNLPKITMETLSATGFNIILIVTYVSFAAAIILYLVLDSGSKQTIQMNGSLCGSNTSVVERTYPFGKSSSCTIANPDNSTLFTGNITDMVNLIGDIEFYVMVPAEKMQNSSLPFIELSIDLFGCTRKEVQHCKFEEVLKKEKLSGLINYEEDGVAYYRGVIVDSFQNQEIIQNNGIVSAYQFNIMYKNNERIVRGGEVLYEFHYYSVYNPMVLKIMQCILCCFTVIYAVIWFSALLQDELDPRKWLRERKWLSWFLIGLFFFQNPIYCIAQWDVGVDYVTGWTAYLSSIMTFTGQTIIFTVFLLIADGIAEKTSFGFYFPKICFGILMLLMFSLMTSIDYPSIFDPQRSPILSVMNWPHNLQLQYAICGTSLLLLILYWIIYFIFATIRTGRKLRKIPYIKARQEHLAYRFFLLQAVLVGAVFVLEYIVDFSNIFVTGVFVFRTEKIADYLNSLFNSQNESLSWILFISVYVYLALYLYLPVDRANMHYFLARSYVLREAEIFAAKQIRQQDLQELKRFGIFIPKFVERKPIFCVETARWMLELSYQAYYDPPEKPTVPDSLGPVDVEQFGFKILDFLWDEEHDTNCFVLRHCGKKKLAVVFRGSMSKEHWADNLKLHLQAIDIHTLCPRGQEEHQPALLGEDLREYMVDLEERPSQPFLGRMRDNVQRLPKQFVQAGRTGVEFVRDELEIAADITRINRIPGLKHALIGYVHTGFWEAYACIREDLHRSVRKHLLDDELQLFITGHSLGGALASIASLDLMVHTVPKVNAVWASRRGLESGEEFEGMCTITMYNFGSPRVGNHPFRHAYNKLVPHSFRVVCDGDFVAGLPPRFFYQHLGTEVIIDGEGSGNLIIDPSVAEKKFQIRSRSSLNFHHMKHYRKGICSILGEEIDREILEDLLRPPPPEEVVEMEEVEQSGAIKFFDRIGSALNQATHNVGNFFQFKRTRNRSIEDELEVDQPLAESLL